MHPPPQSLFCCCLFCCWEIQSAFSSFLQTLRERSGPGEERQPTNKRFGFLCKST
ncbi:unnamed protein product [Sphagnum jensenii]|uniref:Uncharacterized protein n=1 Tax=Sphagnum jensenii TaxID=128206 RepID=A0ABP1ABA8_9BRYO